MTLDKEQMRKIRAALDKALAEVATAEGLAKLVSGNCSFDRDGSFTFKVEGIVAGGLDIMQTIYDVHRGMLGLPIRGTKFKGPNGKTHEIWGMTKRGGSILTLCDGQKRQWKNPDDVRALVNPVKP